MPLTPGEQFSVFLLLATERGTLRQLLEGSHNVNGSVVGAAGPAANAGALQDRARQQIAALGIDPSHLDAPVNLALLFDPNGTNNVTTDQARIAGALAIADYGGNCPPRATETAIFRGIKGSLG
jgi:hypothetical protein